MGPQYRSCFLSPFWRLQLRGAPRKLKKLCIPVFFENVLQMNMLQRTASEQSPLMHLSHSLLTSRRSSLCTLRTCLIITLSISQRQSRPKELHYVRQCSKSVLSNFWETKLALRFNIIHNNFIIYNLSLHYDIQF